MYELCTTQHSMTMTAATSAEHSERLHDRCPRPQLATTPHDFPYQECVPLPEQWQCSLLIFRSRYNSHVALRLQFKWFQAGVGLWNGG